MADLTMADLTKSFERARKIYEKIGRKAVLEQAIEEAGEFIACAAKHLRIMRGTNPTPISLSDNKNNLLEETADIRLCLDLVILALNDDLGSTLNEIANIADKKTTRWLNRLGIEEQ